MATVKKRTWRTAKGEKREAWRVSYTDGDGQRQHKQFALKRDADAYRIKVEGEVSLGIHTADAASVTVGEACDIWIRKGEADDLEWGTLKQRRELVRLHIKPLLGSDKLSRLTMPKVEQFKDTLVTTRSRVMASKIVRALSSVLIEAMRQGLVAQNVARGVKIKKKGNEQTPVVIPDTAVLRAMLEAAERQGNEAPDVYPMILLAISAGLRGSELRGLRWPDLDFKAGSVTIRQRADQRGVLGKCKSAAAYRTVPLALPVVTALKAWKLRCPPCESELVFPNRAGRPIHVNNLREYKWEPILKAIGATTATDRSDCQGREIVEHHYGLHDLRHACASRWIKQKIDLKRLTTWLGHSSVQITLDVYGHLIKDEGEDAAIVGAACAELLA